MTSPLSIDRFTRLKPLPSAYDLAMTAASWTVTENAEIRRFLRTRLEPELSPSAILTYHVVPGNVSSEDVAQLPNATTVNGRDLKITAADGKVMVGNATVTQADILASNGVIHVIDTVLLPE